jgi:hypothetical protein
LALLLLLLLLPPLRLMLLPQEMSAVPADCVAGAGLPAGRQ